MNNEIQISENLPYGISTKSVKVFMGYMECSAYSENLRYQILTSVEQFVGYMKMTDLWLNVNRALLQNNTAKNRIFFF